MGGQGSGRPPSTETLIARTTPIQTPVGTGIFLPNYSGLKTGTKKTDTLNLSGVVFVGTSGEFTTDSTFVYDDTNNYLGVGTASPGYKLQVGGALSTAPSSLVVASFQGTTAGSSSAQTRVAIGQSASGQGAVNTLVSGVTSGTAPYFAIETRDAGGAITEKLRIIQGGNVGIGTTSPAYNLQIGSNIWNNLGSNYKLAVAGDAVIGNSTSGSSPYLRIYEGTEGSYGQIKKYQNYTELSDGKGLALNPNAGNVGIGTTSPSYKLQVGGAVVGTIGSTIMASFAGPDAVSSSAQTRVVIGQQASGGTSGTTALVTGVTSGTNPYFAIETRDGGDGIIKERLRIGSTGNVGIGTASPTQKLEVSGGNVLMVSGGIMVSLIAGEALSGGMAVRASRSADQTILRAGITDGTDGRDQAIGIVGTSTTNHYAIGAVVPVIVAGKARVLVENTTTTGDFVQPSATTSGALISAAYPPSPADANHWRECGHCIESGVSGALVAAIIHFN